MQNIYIAVKTYESRFIVLLLRIFFQNFQIYQKKNIGFLKLINLHNYDNCICYLEHIHLQYLFSVKVPKTHAQNWFLHN